MKYLHIIYHFLIDFLFFFYYTGFKLKIRTGANKMERQELMKVMVLTVEIQQRLKDNWRMTSSVFGKNFVGMSKQIGKCFDAIENNNMVKAQICIHSLYSRINLIKSKLNSHGVLLGKENKSARNGIFTLCKHLQEILKKIMKGFL